MEDLSTEYKQDGKVNIFVPIDIADSIQKSNENPTAKNWYVRGYATTPDLDLQDDMVMPGGIDISHLIQYGHINYEHQQGLEYRIGEPTEGTHVDPERGLYVEGKLYKSNPHAKSIWNLAENLHKSGGTRKLGYSIEGYARKRNDDDPRIIEKTFITNVALTTSPANPHATWEAFMKSFTTGHGISPETQTNAGALRAESFARSLHNLSHSFANLQDPKEFNTTWKDIGGQLDSMNSFSPETAIMFIQLSKGLSRKQAIQHMDQFMNKVDK